MSSSSSSRRISSTRGRHGLGQARRSAGSPGGCAIGPADTPRPGRRAPAAAWPTVVRSRVSAPARESAAEASLSSFWRARSRSRRAGSTPCRMSARASMRMSSSTRARARSLVCSAAASWPARLPLVQPHQHVDVDPVGVLLGGDVRGAEVGVCHPARSSSVRVTAASASRSAPAGCPVALHPGDLQPRLRLEGPFAALAGRAQRLAQRAQRLLALAQGVEALSDVAECRPGRGRRPLHPDLERAARVGERFVVVAKAGEQAGHAGSWDETLQSLLAGCSPSARGKALPRTGRKPRPSCRRRARV